MSHLTLQQRELAAIGAALASNCIPCIKFHIQKGRETGLSDGAIAEAVEVAELVRRVPARKVREAANAALGRGASQASNAEKKAACGGAAGASESLGERDSPCCGSGVSP